MIKPNKLRIEASSHCQLRCPACPTTTGAIHPAIGSGFLKLDDFCRLLDANPGVRLVELSNYGEIFLNPALLDIMREADERKVMLTASNGANLNHARPEVLEGLVRYRFRTLTCSIDGASEETYRRYRVRGSLDRVIGNIERINEHKKRLGSRFPVLKWQFVAFGHNQHEIRAASRRARELGMKFYLKLSWDDAVFPLRDLEAVRQHTTERVATRGEYREKFGADFSDEICLQLWDQPQINWDGKMLGCCRNFWGDFGGNAFRDGLAGALNGEKASYARDMLQGAKPPRDDIPCTTCDIYLDRRKAGRWVRRG